MELKRWTLLACCAAAALSNAIPARAQEPQQAQPVRLNYVNADLRDVIRSIAAMLNLNVVMTDVPERRITFSTPAPISAADLQHAFEMILESNGLVLIRSNSIAQIVSAQRAPDTALRTYVYRLKHANAVELAQTLAQVFGIVTGAAPLQTRTEALQDRSLSRTLDAFSRRELAALEMRRNTPIPQIGVATADTTGGQLASLVGQTTIVAEPATNSLVIRTAPPNYALIQQTIDMLDIRPSQVLLEVLIAEITLDRATEFGVDWSVANGKVEVSGRNADVSGKLGPQFGDSLLNNLQDFVLRITRLNSVDVRAVLRALATRTDVRVLSTPHVLALNNQEARILVGSEVPFNQSTRAGLDVIVDRVIQYRDVGTQLTIIPTINPDRYVTFRILQEVSALTTQTLPAALNAPIITTREAETSALVKDGETIVIGGLIGNQSDVVESGVPLLKDIPLLGALFRSRSTRQERTELAIFLTPYVVATDEEARDILERERNRLRELPESVKRDLTPRRPGEPE